MSEESHMQKERPDLTSPVGCVSFQANNAVLGNDTAPLACHLHNG